MECPVAQGLTARTMARLGNCPACFGIRPAGQLMPLMLVGLKAAGVTLSTTFRSKVSVWLGAPAIRMKMTFLAVFCVETGFELTTTPAGAGLPAMQAAVTPEPKIRNSSRRVKCG